MKNNEVTEGKIKSISGEIQIHKYYKGKLYLT